MFHFRVDWCFAYLLPTLLESVSKGIQLDTLYDQHRI